MSKALTGTKRSYNESVSFVFALGVAWAHTSRVCWPPKLKQLYVRSSQRRYPSKSVVGTVEVSYKGLQGYELSCFTELEKPDNQSACNFLPSSLVNKQSWSLLSGRRLQIPW